VRIRIERKASSRTRVLGVSFFLLTLAGCGGEPSDREVKNARAFEALLSAVSLKNAAELEKDAALIDERHDAGELSDAPYKELREVIARARAKDWAGAEKRAYEFRSRFGDRGSYFK
jgi:hypothetical protein